MSTPRPRPAVPAYFHPARDAGTWELLGRRQVDLVVVNPCSGVGAAIDPAYVDVRAGRLRCTIAGYIDTAYARRPIVEVVGEAVTYARRYGVGSVFLDQVTSGAADLPHYRELTRRLRSAGVGRVVLNPGTVPDDGYFGIADVVVTFEDTAERYRCWDPGVVPTGPAVTWHLVHGAPADTHVHTLATAARRGATYAYVTDRTLPNPWDGLPAGWADTTDAPEGHDT